MRVVCVIHVRLVRLARIVRLVRVARHGSITLRSHALLEATFADPSLCYPLTNDVVVSFSYDHIV